MDDIRLRDLSRVPESQLTREEREELRRRYNEFVGRLRKEGSLPPSKPVKKNPNVEPWDPRKSARRT